MSHGPCVLGLMVRLDVLTRQIAAFGGARSTFILSENLVDLNLVGVHRRQTLLVPAPRLTLRAASAPLSCPLAHDLEHSRSAVAVQLRRTFFGPHSPKHSPGNLVLECLTLQTGMHVVCVVGLSSASGGHSKQLTSARGLVTDSLKPRGEPRPERLRQRLFAPKTPRGQVSQAAPSVSVPFIRKPDHLLDILFTGDRPRGRLGARNPALALGAHAALSAFCFGSMSASVGTFAGTACVA
ncbi:hypothetical protein SAMN05443639_10795 [Stigmatella erecta]|uniref:Uncharacterized protein n=1 Tax=Stigmatella erecta TaxID=83460 RepID=A0A1I0JA76_9BACT|nr:hypothetical protein SAMN05443639_10795 [Stigmatella erecta]